MKNIFILLFFIAAHAYAQEVDILSVELGVEDQDQIKSLCITVVREPQSERLVGVVEDIYDCFYARTAKKNLTSTMNLPMKRFRPLQHEGLLQHLQQRDPQLEFLFSDGE